MQRSNNAEKDTSLHCRALPFNEDAASQHHNQKHHSDRACVDESVLAQKKHQQRQHYEDWICLASVHQEKRCPLHLDAPEEGTSHHHQQPVESNTKCAVSPSKHSLEKYQRRDKSPSSGRTHCQQHLNPRQTFALSADRTWGHSGESLHCSCRSKSGQRQKLLRAGTLLFKVLKITWEETQPTTFSRCPRRLTQRLLGTERLHPIFAQ